MELSYVKRWYYGCSSKWNFVIMKFINGKVQLCNRFMKKGFDSCRQHTNISLLLPKGFGEDWRRHALSKVCSGYLRSVAENIYLGAFVRLASCQMEKRTSYTHSGGAEQQSRIRDNDGITPELEAMMELEALTELEAMTELGAMTESPQQPSCSHCLLDGIPAPMNNAGSIPGLVPCKGKTGELRGGGSCQEPFLSFF